MEMRNATVEDAPAISRIYALSWKKAYIGMIPQEYLDELPESHWTAAFQKWLGEGEYEVLLAIEDNEPIGAITFGASRDKAGWGEIQSFYVLPKHWRKGVGRELMQSALAALKTAGYQNAYLWVLDQNKSAQKFYTSVGFVPTNDTLQLHVGGKDLLDYRYIISM